MFFERKSEIGFLLQALLWINVDAHVCFLTKIQDPVTGRMRFALSSEERCYCTKVLSPAKIFSKKCNAFNLDIVGSLWFPESPGLLTTRQNWTPEILDDLLERKAVCGTTTRSTTPRKTPSETTSGTTRTHTTFSSTTHQKSTSETTTETTPASTTSSPTTEVPTTSPGTTKATTYQSSTGACDCGDLLNTHGVTMSGEYTIYPDAGVGQVAMKVWCDMETDGGGWTVFQRRQDGSVDFLLDWADYKGGFPLVDDSVVVESSSSESVYEYESLASESDCMVNTTGEFWLGNDNLYTLSNNVGKTYELRVDMNDGKDDACAIYGDFVIADETDKYRLSLGAYGLPPCTAAGNALSDRGNGEQFSTKDQDNDSHGDARQHCAQTFKGGWWYGACHYANLNGEYKDPPGEYSGSPDGVCWTQWKGLHFSLTKVEMKIREQV